VPQNIFYPKKDYLPSKIKNLIKTPFILKKELTLKTLFSKDGKDRKC